MARRRRLGKCGWREMWRLRACAGGPLPRLAGANLCEVHHDSGHGTTVMRDGMNRRRVCRGPLAGVALPLRAPAYATCNIRMRLLGFRVSRREPAQADVDF